MDNLPPNGAVSDKSPVLILFHGLKFIIFTCSFPLNLASSRPGGMRTNLKTTYLQNLRKQEQFKTETFAVAARSLALLKI